MPWLEMVMVRSFEHVWTSPDPIAGELVATTGTAPGLIRAALYTSAVMGTDLCILLEWNSPEAQPGGSVLGNRVAEALRETGLVHHTVWKEEETP